MTICNFNKEIKSQILTLGCDLSKSGEVKMASKLSVLWAVTLHTFNKAFLKQQQQQQKLKLFFHFLIVLKIPKKQHTANPDYRFSHVPKA